MAYRPPVASLALALALTGAAVASHATTVFVMSVDHGRAQLLVNGTAVRDLRAGQTSPEGVRLVSADRTTAVIEVDGRELALGLGGSTVATAELKADRWGQHVTTAFVNGIAIRAMIDTGAAMVSLSRDEAERMSIRYAGAPRVQVDTAGGPRAAYRVGLATVRVGGITLHNVDGLVMERGREELPIAVIGMSFLRSVEMRRVGDTLTLTKRD